MAGVPLSDEATGLRLKNICKQGENMKSEVFVVVKIKVVAVRVLAP
jgi:hypothetical protein